MSKFSQPHKSSHAVRRWHTVLEFCHHPRTAQALRVCPVRVDSLGGKLMIKKSASEEVGKATATTEGTLDSRFAAKLTKRLKKEAEAISETGKATKAGQRELDKAFDMLDTALRDHDARLLVTANAELRVTDNAVASKRS